MYKTFGSHDREEIDSGMKSNVIHFRLKPFHTEYGYLDSEYYYIHMFSQGSTQKLARCLFPLHLIKAKVVRKHTNFNLTDITGDESLLALLPPKNSDYYPLSVRLFYYPLSVRLFYCRHGLGKMDAKFMITPRTEAALYIQNKKKSRKQKFLFSAKIREFEKIFPKEKELIEYEEQKEKLKIWRKKKNYSLKFLEGQKIFLLDQQERKKIFLQTYILYDESGVVKPTFVSELHQEVNIFSEFTIFYENAKNFINNNNKKEMFQLKKSYTGEKEFSLTLRQLDGSASNFF